MSIPYTRPCPFSSATILSKASVSLPFPHVASTTVSPFRTILLHTLRVGYLGGLPPAGEKAHHRIVRPCNEKHTPQSQQIYRPGKSDFRAEEKEWTSLWHVQVPSKIRVFLWRLARQTLPLGDLLHHRKMAPSNICAICGAEDSWKHALLDCNMARCVWALEKEDIAEFIGALQEHNARHG